MLIDWTFGRFLGVEAGYSLQRDATGVWLYVNKRRSRTPDGRFWSVLYWTNRSGGPRWLA